MASPLTKSGVLLLILTPSLLLAEEADQENVSLLETVVVSGELQARDVQDTTTSVSVFSKKRLEESSDTTIYDTLNRSANATSAFGSTGFAIRGVVQNGVGGGSGRTVNVSVDGASLPTAQSTFFGPYSTWDLEQVEILRGPQSTQQGRNAIAGAVNVRSSDPDFTRETKLRVRAGSDGESDIALMHNQPINDKLAARIALEKNHSDGFIINPTRNEDDYDERDLSLIRGKLLYIPSDNLSVVLGHNYTDSRGGFDQVLRSEFPDNRINPSDHEADQGSKHNITTLTADYDINDRWSVRSETTHYKHDYNRLEDFDVSAEPLGILDRQLDDKSVSQEVKFTYDNDGKVRGAVGLFATRIEANWDGEIDGDASLVDARIPVGFANFRREIDRTTNTKNIAVFGELDYDLSTKWGLIAGARYDYEKIEIADSTKYFIDPAGVVPLPADDAINVKTSFNAFLPKVGVKYRFNEDISSSFTIQQGYRAGGTDRNPLTLVATEFDPEYTTNYELSLRSRVWDDRLKINGNIYYTDWKDQQVRVQGESGDVNDSDLKNAGKSTLYGAEVEFELGVSDKLELYSSLGYAKTEFKEFVSEGNDLSGNSFALAPKVTASLGGKYKFNSQWSFQLDGNYKGSFYSDVENTLDTKVSSRFVVDAKLGYDAKNWGANVYARNLFDKDYLTQANDTTTRVGDPREVGLEFNYKF